MLYIRLDIAFAVSIVLRYAARPTKQHKTAIKLILRYLKGTANLTLVYYGDIVLL